MKYLTDGYNCPICRARTVVFLKRKNAYCETCSAEYEVQFNRDIDFPYKFLFTGFGDEMEAVERMHALATLVEKG